jgi:hypothetical protein
VWVVDRTHAWYVTERQWAMVAARLADMRQGRPSEESPNGGSKQADVASLLGVGKRTVERARRVLASGDEELISKVD